MSVATAVPRPDIRIRPGGTWLLDFHELWLFRGLLITLAWRDIKVRYKQTVLGVLWVVLQPLVGAGIFTFIFGTVADLPVENQVPTFLAAFAGLQAYTLFSSTVNKASHCLLGNTHLITKIYFPRLILPLSNVPTILVDFSVALGLLAVLMAVWKVVPGPALLLAPLWILGLLALAMGFGLIAASFAVHYRDVRYVVPVITQFAVWVAPVGYTFTAVAQEVEDEWLLHLYLLNPLSSLIEGLRWSLLGTNAPHPYYTAYSFLVAIVALIVGATWFTAMERRFADVI